MAVLSDPKYRKHPRSGNWEVNYYVIDGARKLRRFKGGFPRQFDAKKWFEDLRKSVEIGDTLVDSNSGKVISRDIPRLSQFFASLGEIGHHKSKKSQALDEITHRHFMEFMKVDRYVDSIGTKDIEQFLKYRKDIGRKAWTLIREMGTLKAAFNTALRWGYIKKNPCEGIARIKPPEGEVEYLPPEAQVKLINACKEISQNGKHNANLDSPYLYPLVLMALRTGMRKGELFHLRWSDIDFERKSIKIRELDEPTGWQTKSRKSRFVPLDNQVIEALEWWKEWFDKEKERAAERCKDLKISLQLRLKAEYRLNLIKSTAPFPRRLVFPSFRKFDENGEPLPMDNINKAWENAREIAFGTIEAGEDIPEGAESGLHSLRHTFAVTCAKNNVPIVVLKELMGHSDIQTTQIYLRFYPNDQAFMIKLPELDGI